MKSTARRLFVLAVTVFTTGLLQFALAQDQPQGPPRGMGQGMRMSPKERAEAMAKQLDLDTATTAKVVAVFEKYQKVMADKRNELQGDMDGMRAAMTEIREKQNKELTALLTKEQAAKYEQIQKELQQRMQNRPPRNN